MFQIALPSHDQECNGSITEQNETNLDDQDWLGDCGKYIGFDRCSLTET